MSIIENAVAFALKIAADDNHGYDQAKRWGPDYDCSSLVITSFKQAGVPLTCTYTGNMRADMLQHGFADITFRINRESGEGLKRGDVLLNNIHHTALYIGDGRIVQASINENGTVTGGQPGDQTGREIATRGYYNYPWDCVLRYVGADSPSAGTRPVRTWTPALLQYKPGRALQVGPDVSAAQALLACRGYELDIDGEYGPASAAAVTNFQKSTGLLADGECGPDTWAELLKIDGGDA